LILITLSTTIDAAGDDDNVDNDDVHDDDNVDAGRSS
jgi:hypothetical protein